MKLELQIALLQKEVVDMKKKYEDDQIILDILLAGIEKDIDDLEKK